MIRLIALAGLAAFVLAGCDRGGAGGAQETAASDAASLAPLADPATGEITLAFAGTERPAMTFSDHKGRTLDLGTINQPVLLNLWATWCAPCVVEMPALDNLAGAMEGRLRVLTVSQDLRGADVVEPFFAARDFERIEPWLDPEASLTSALADGGALPVTILFDRGGREILRVSGGYEWDSEEAIALVSEALAEAEPAR